MVRNSTTSTPSPLILGGIDAFRTLPEGERAKIAARMHLRRYAKRDVVLRQGDNSRRAFFLISGFVKVVRGGALSTREGDQRVRTRQETALAILGPGHMIGELSVFTGAPRSASAVALSESNLVEVAGEVLLDIVHQYPVVAVELLKYLSRRLIEANHQAELLRAPTEARLVGTLRLFRQIGLPDELFPTNAELGRMVGASREMVSRIVNRQKTITELP